MTTARVIDQFVETIFNPRIPQGLKSIFAFDGGEVLLNVLRCQLTYLGQVVTNAEARFSNSLRPRKPEDSLGRTAQDGHRDSHTASELTQLQLL